MLGNAAGTVARAYGHFFPRTAIDAVEIDGELFDIGRRYFDLDNPRMEEFAEDARPFLERSDGGYEAIMVDAYRQPYIPFYLATEEFFDLARERLAPGGVVIVNAGHPEGNDDLETVLGRTMEAAFPTVLRFPIEDTNTLLVASESPISGARLRRAIDDLPPGLAATAAGAAAGLEPRLPGGEVYTDDRAPVEWLIDTSFLGYANEN
jgi:spermidine synthase